MQSRAGRLSSACLLPLLEFGIEPTVALFFHFPSISMLQIRFGPRQAILKFIESQVPRYAL